MDVIKLTQKLVSIPSYLSSKTNEKEIGNFVFSYLKKFPYFQVKKQKVEGERFNIIAKTKGTPQLFLAGHMDTVEPGQGWFKSPFGRLIKKNKLYGLGALDMKSGMAAILDSLKDFKDSGSNAHSPNEWVDIVSLKNLRHIYASIIRAYCRIK